MKIRSYTALGDSFTAGTGCEPGESWPDLLAGALRKRYGEVALTNLAFQGATSADVEAQVAKACERPADLVTIVFGANDVLGTTRPDVDAYERRLERCLDRLLELDTLVVTATVPERWHFMGLGPRTAARVSRGITELNVRTRSVAAAHAVPCLDVAGHPALSETRSFSPDGLHPSPLGHRRAAGGFCALLNHHFGMELETDEREGVRDAIGAA